MKIRSIETFRVTLPFRLSFAHSLASRSLSENLVVKVTLEDGSTGYGEGIPRDYVTGEDAESAERRVLSSFWPALSPLDEATCPSSELARLHGELGLDTQPYGAAWCAFELAVLDAWYRSRVASFARLLLPQRTRVRYGGVVPFGKKKVLEAILWFYKLYGFQTVKLKVGDDQEADLAKVSLARRIMGPSATIRVDANCAWSLDEALFAAERFRPYRVASYEQPLPAGDLEGLRKLSRSIEEDVLVDESLCTVAQAELLAAEGVCDAFNVRVSKVGGLLAATRIAAIARDHGLKVHMGAQVGESGILSAAGRWFALSQGTLENCEGSANAFLLRTDLTRENLTAGPGGFADLRFARKTCGLGVTVDEPRLLRLTGGGERAPHGAAGGVAEPPQRDLEAGAMTGAAIEPLGARGGRRIEE